MKTWRERIAEARERGAFTEEDYAMWSVLSTCPAGEVTLRYGIGTSEPHFNSRLHRMGTLLGLEMDKHDFAGAERVLDAIEDEGLRIKRERAQ